MAAIEFALSREAAPPPQAASPAVSAPKTQPAAVAKPEAAPAPAPEAKPAKAPAKAAAVVKGKGAEKQVARRGERQPSALYVRLRDAWHEPIHMEPSTTEAGGLPPLVLAPVNGGGVIASITPEREDGGFSPESQKIAAQALSPGRTRSPHPIAPHLLDLVYRAMRHFDAPLVHVISGYRADRAGSRHTQGRAIDMVIPGVSNEELAAYLRTFGFVGVGIYPKSGFVHLDVRPASFYWVDNSLPDERCVTQQVMAEEAKLADQAARERGEQPDYYVPNNDREDRAAARAYKRRAEKRKVAAQRARSF